MKHLFQAIIFILIVCILPVCKKDTQSTYTPPGPPPPPAGPGPTPPPTAPPSSGSAPYSGKWTGNISVKDSLPAVCYYLNHNLQTTQNWTVLADSVQVEEIIIDGNTTWVYYWRGTIRNDTLEMSSKRNINCGGEIKLREILVKAPITSLADKYSVQTSSVYIQCPPDCIFIYSYVMSKPK